MDKLSMCRICLVEDVKMYSLISAKLEELYQRLTEIPFVTEDKKPVQVCYLCYARLQNCHRLQVACFKSEEFFNKVIADSEFNEMELQDLNTLKTVHPLVLISCVSSTIKDPENDKIDEDDDFKVDPLEITLDVHVKHELFEEDSFSNEAVYFKSEGTVEEEDNSTEDDMSDNRHTMHNTELEQDAHLKTAKIVLERIDLEQYKIGRFAAKKPKPDLPNENTESTVSSKTEIEVTVVENNNIEKQIQTMESPSIVKNKNIVEQISFIEKHTKEKKPDSYTCKVCEKSFNHFGNFVSHTRIHTGERPYRCDICEKIFNRSSTLVRHLRVHTGERPYRCSVCGQKFVTTTHLQAHSRKHSGERPYSCQICEKSFSQKSTLVTHTRIHTGERPYRCNICEQSFNKKSHLQTHSRIHSGDKPYSCVICEKSFSVKSSLIYHSRIHTGEKPYSCDICERSFARKWSLVKHTTIWHDQ